MTTQAVIDYLMGSGQFIIFIMMFLEGLNLTGIPAVVILPALGILAAQSTTHLISVLAIAILGSIAGNVFYYCVVLMIGPKIYHKLYDKFKGIRKSLDKADKLIAQHGNKACCIGRLIPGARTVISLMGGTFKIPFWDFLIYSTIGIAIWNGVLIFVGYGMGALKS